MATTAIRERSARASTGTGPLAQSRPLPGASQRLGDYGERLAARFLTEQGLVVLARRWRHGRLGELDLVARDGACLVAVEVKTRRGTAFGAPIEQVTVTKLRRLRRLLAAWLVEQGPCGCVDVRVDVVGVLCRPTGPCVVEHLRAVG